MKTTRTLWRSHTLGQHEDQPWLWLLLKYRRRHDCYQDQLDPNLVGSVTLTGSQMPIVDLDVPHMYTPSSTAGHAHLYINVELPRWRWAILQLGLCIGRVQGTSYSLLSIKRGANFVRLPGLAKSRAEQEYRPEYGWLMKRKVQS